TASIAEPAGITAAAVLLQPGEVVLGSGGIEPHGKGGHIRVERAEVVRHTRSGVAHGALVCGVISFKSDVGGRLWPRHVKYRSGPISARMTAPVIERGRAAGFVESIIGNRIVANHRRLIAAGRGGDDA